MRTTAVLRNLFKVILDEATHNAEFGRRLERALLDNQHSVRLSMTRKRSGPQTLARTSKRTHRRAAATLDPIEVSRQGEPILRARLGDLTIDQLKDIVAEYGMDSGKLAMKWKSAARLVDRIVEVSLGRAKKGDAFLGPANSEDNPPARL